MLPIWDRRQARQGFEFPWTRFVKSRDVRCAGGNDAALYDNCTSFQIPIFFGEPLTCQVFEPLQRIHMYFSRARIWAGDAEHVVVYGRTRRRPSGLATSSK